MQTENILKRIELLNLKIHLAKYVSKEADVSELKNEIKKLQENDGFPVYGILKPQDETWVKIECLKSIDSRIGTKSLEENLQVFEEKEKDSVNIATTFTDGVKYKIENGNAIVSAFAKTCERPTIHRFVYDRGKYYIVTKIGLEACKDNKKIRKLVIPATIEKISYGAFANCVSLEEIFFSNSPCLLEAYAFAGCSHIKSIDIPAAVKVHGISVFKGCSSLTQITFKDGSSFEGSDIFQNCVKLKRIIFEGVNPPKIKDNLIVSGDGKTLLACSVKQKGDVVLPVEITKIAPYAFFQCVQIESVSSNGKIQAVGTSAFSGCTNLVRLNIGESFEFGEGVLDACPKFPKENIPKCLIGQIFSKKSW